MADKKTTAEPKAKRCFMITPIGDAGSEIRKHADWVFKFAVQPVMAEKGFESTRADMMDDPFMINDSVFAAIDEADICVADLTNLNANVFYELGIRHALEKPVIHIAHVGTRIPFDTANYRTIWFDLTSIESMQELKGQIASHVDTILKPGFKLSNPLTQARGFQRMATSADPKDQLIADLERRLSKVESDSRQRARGPSASPSSGLPFGLNSLVPDLLGAAYESSLGPDGQISFGLLSEHLQRMLPGMTVTRPQLEAFIVSYGVPAAHARDVENFLRLSGALPANI